MPLQCHQVEWGSQNWPGSSRLPAAPRPTKDRGYWGGGSLEVPWGPTAAASDCVENSRSVLTLFPPVSHGNEAWAPPCEASRAGTISPNSQMEERGSGG